MTNQAFRKQALQVLQLTKDYIGIELSLSDLFNKADSYDDLINYKQDDINRMKWFVSWANQIKTAETDLLTNNINWNDTTFATLLNALQWMDIKDEKFDELKDFCKHANNLQ